MDILFDQIKFVWSLLSTPLFELGNSQISLASLFVVLLILGGFFMISRIIERGVKTALKNKAIDPGIKGSIERFSRYLTVAVGADAHFVDDVLMGKAVVTGSVVPSKLARSNSVPTPTGDIILFSCCQAGPNTIA